jgi:RNA polymerase sigma-70 factor (ECF subfamily)
LSEGRVDAELVPPEEERAVVARLQRGDRSAVAVLYGWYGDRLYRQAILPRLPVPEAAEDVLRDTFRTVLEKIGTFTWQDRSVYFWLRRVAINKAMDAHRARQRDQRLADAAEREEELAGPARAPRPDAGLEQADLQRMIGLSLDKLNPRYAEALRMRLLEDRSREECAAHFGITVNNFDVLLHRAAKAFRENYPP